MASVAGNRTENADGLIAASRWLGAATWSYPVILVSSFYAVWLLAWGILGHRPRLYLDDPGMIGSGFGVAYVASGILLVCFPAAMIVGLCVTVASPAAAGRSWPRRVFAAAAFLALWIAAIAVLRWDPLAVGDWYMD